MKYENWNVENVNATVASKAIFDSEYSFNTALINNKTSILSGMFGCLMCFQLYVNQ